MIDLQEGQSRDVNGEKGRSAVATRQAGQGRPGGVLWWRLCAASPTHAPHPEAEGAAPSLPSRRWAGWRARGPGPRGVPALRRPSPPSARPQPVVTAAVRAGRAAPGAARDSVRPLVGSRRLAERAPRPSYESLLSACGGSLLGVRVRGVETAFLLG